MSARECPYCHGMGSATNVRLLPQPDYDFVQLYVDPVRACICVRDVWSEIRRADISYCPMCGRRLKEDSDA